jgi:hypothetical protein
VLKRILDLIVLLDNLIIKFFEKATYTIQNWTGLDIFHQHLIFLVGGSGFSLWIARRYILETSSLLLGAVVLAVILNFLVTLSYKRDHDNGKAYSYRSMVGEIREDEVKSLDRVLVLIVSSLLVACHSGNAPLAFILFYSQFTNSILPHEFPKGTKVDKFKRIITPGW